MVNQSKEPSFKPRAPCRNNASPSSAQAHRAAKLQVEAWWSNRAQGCILPEPGTNSLETWPLTSGCFIPSKITWGSAPTMMTMTISGWWFHPLWKILVNWDDYFQYDGKIVNVPNHQSDMEINIHWLFFRVLGYPGYQLSPPTSEATGQVFLLTSVCPRSHWAAGSFDWVPLG